MIARGFFLTFSLIIESIGFNHLLLNLGGHREHKLQHLAHVVAGTLSSLLHPCSIFWYRESLDHLTQYHCKNQQNTRSSCFTLWIISKTATQGHLIQCIAHFITSTTNLFNTPTQRQSGTHMTTHTVANEPEKISLFVSEWKQLWLISGDEEVCPDVLKILYHSEIRLSTRPEER